MMTTSTTDQYSAHYSEQLQYNWVDFLFPNLIVWFWHWLGFVSYLCGLFLDSFQTTKKHPYHVYSIYMLIFNSSLKAVYPVGVTTNRSCFMQTISDNSRNHQWICSKVGTEIHFNAPVLCTKFQIDPSMHSRFMAIFISVRKDEE